MFLLIAVKGIFTENILLIQQIVYYFYGELAKKDIEEEEVLSLILICNKFWNHVDIEYIIEALYDDPDRNKIEISKLTDNEQIRLYKKLKLMAD